MAVKSNATPMSDICLLISTSAETDADGYGANVESSREVWCSFYEGTVRSEFYEAAKAGIRVSATVEVWEDDYDGETLVSIEDTRYRLVRSFPSGHGTLYLSLEEVMR